MAKQRKEKILVVDDEENIRKSLKMILEYEGYTFLEAPDGEDALDIVEETIGLDLIFLDIKLPGMDGLEVLAEIKKRPYSPEVVMISGHGTVQTAVEATKLGAYDLIEKPLSIDKVIVTINNALYFRRLEEENQYLRKKMIEKNSISGSSPPTQALKQQIAVAAPTDT